MLILFATICCSGGNEPEQKHISYNSLQEVPDSSWAKLADKKVYFGHQSVGFNIIAGINDLMKENPKIKLNIVEGTSIEAKKSGVFLNSRVGQNTDPESKMEDFSKFLDHGLGQQLNIAALKFCYVDVTKDTNVAAVFNEYKAKMAALKAKFPDLTIVHFTEPLTVSKSNWKTFLKKLIGKKDLWEFEDNVKRNEYNNMLIKEYQGKEPIFDIAKLESTKPDGSRQSFEQNGQTYYSMVPEYTKDGGHLNELGRKMVAEQFLLLLINTN